MGLELMSEPDDLDLDEEGGGVDVDVDAEGEADAKEDARSTHDADKLTQ